MDPRRLLEQFMGSGTAQRDRGDAPGQRGGLDLGGLNLGRLNPGSMAMGGVLGLLLGSKKARKMAGGLAGSAVGYGGAAALGALAYRAYRNWQEGQQAAPPPAPAAALPGSGPYLRPGSVPQVAAPPAAVPRLPEDSPFLPANAPARDGRPFELALVAAMIGAANADGHIGGDEQRLIFGRVGEMPLDAEDKAFVFDMLANPPGLDAIAGLANGPEQAAELYLASRLAIDPDDPAERVYLEALAHRLALPPALVAHLEAQLPAPA
jgi:uncharacterized membrane protein YebE (DUF533 family)